RCRDPASEHERLKPRSERLDTGLDGVGVAFAMFLPVRGHARRYTRIAIKRLAVARGSTWIDDGHLTHHEKGLLRQTAHPHPTGETRQIGDVFTGMHDGALARHFARPGNGTGQGPIDLERARPVFEALQPAKSRRRYVRSLDQV